jgi:hypothetical protein
MRHRRLDHRHVAGAQRQRRRRGAGQWNGGQPKCRRTQQNRFETHSAECPRPLFERLQPDTASRRRQSRKPGSGRCRRAKNCDPKVILRARNTALAQPALRRTDRRRHRRHRRPAARADHRQRRRPAQRQFRKRPPLAAIRPAHLGGAPDPPAARLRRTTLHLRRFSDRADSGGRVISVSYLALARETRVSGARRRLAKLVPLLSMGGSPRRHPRLPARHDPARPGRLGRHTPAGASAPPSRSASTIAPGTRISPCSATSCCTKPAWCRNGLRRPPGRADAPPCPATP